MDPRQALWVDYGLPALQPIRISCDWQEFRSDGQKSCLRPTAGTGFKIQRRV
jgi:hypothetical protein